ncbi:Hypothetical predicted protein [Podarcis lilfordi]|uniref:Uncharacterized protein n=1 Tax=Podarcis lilfordi TaxID=74358 RepID=A0AA35PG91_9SAUR|nr:Hypothetical predicted protein [Podarcis lilfordi]
MVGDADHLATVLNVRSKDSVHPAPQHLALGAVLKISAVQPHWRVSRYTLGKPKCVAVQWKKNYEDIFSWLPAHK